MICGALTWLQDHNKSEREGLKSYLKKLGETFADSSGADDPFDWLNQQAQEVKARQEKLETQRKLDLLDKYNEKLSKIRLSSKQRVSVRNRFNF